MIVRLLRKRINSPKSSTRSKRGSARARAYFTYNWPIFCATVRTNRRHSSFKPQTVWIYLKINNFSIDMEKYSQFHGTALKGILEKNYVVKWTKQTTKFIQ